MTQARKHGAGAVPRFFYTIDGVSYSVKAYCQARGLTDPASMNRVGSYMSTQRNKATHTTNLPELLKQEVTWAIHKLKDKQQREINQELMQATMRSETSPDAQQLLQKFALNILEALKPQLRAPMESYAAALNERAELFAEFCKTKNYIKELEVKLDEAETYSEQLQEKYAKNREEREELEILLRNVDKQDS